MKNKLSSEVIQMCIDFYTEIFVPDCISIQEHYVNK